jgi:hypothetical protein
MDLTKCGGFSKDSLQDLEQVNLREACRQGVMAIGVREKEMRQLVWAGVETDALGPPYLEVEA